MNKIFALVTLLVMAAACSTGPPANNAPASNANNATTAKPTSALSEADATAKEKETWEAIKKKDYDAFGNMLASDYLEVGGDGVFDKPGLIAFLKELTISDVTFSDWKMLPISKDAVMLVYNVTIKGTSKSGTIPPGPYRVGSAWVHRDGKWQAIFYQETLAKTEPASKTAPPPPSPAGSPAATTSASPATSAAAAVTGPDPIANEKLLWDVIKSKNYNEFAALLAPESIEVEPGGVHDKASSVKGVSSVDFSKVELSDWKSIKFDSNAALVTYMSTTPGARPPRELHSTIWVSRDGKWVALYHQGSPLLAPVAAVKPATSK